VKKLSMLFFLALGLGDSSSIDEVALLDVDNMETEEGW
jgi:hypothetical protein